MYISHWITGLHPGYRYIMCCLDYLQTKTKIHTFQPGCTQAALSYNIYPGCHRLPLHTYTQYNTAGLHPGCNFIQYSRVAPRLRFHVYNEVRLHPGYEYINLAGLHPGYLMIWYSRVTPGLTVNYVKWNHEG